MKTSFFFTSIIISCLLISCSSKSDSSSSPVSETNSVSNFNENIDEESIVKEFLTTLYQDYVFNYQDFSTIKNHFSEKVLNRLRNEYEYDGEGYAVWLFRTGAQDGPNDISQVNSIKKEEKGWYVVEYTDMGYDGKCRFLIQIRNNDVHILDFEQ